MVGMVGGAEAREAVRDLWRGARWDAWVRLSWRRSVAEETALAHLDRLRDLLRHESRGVALVAGLHREPMLHAHALLKLSRKLRVHLINVDEVRDFLQLRWPHGEVWCRPDGCADEDPAGALAYLARHPETVSW